MREILIASVLERDEAMHAMFKGAISFGLVSIPVKMFAATEEKDIRFRTLHKKCHTPIKYKKICPTCGEEVGPDDIVKGFEYEPGRFVIVSEIGRASCRKSVDLGGRRIIKKKKLNIVTPVFSSR